MIVYDNDGKNIVISTTPRVEFDDNVPTWFIDEFLRRMAKGQIKVKDYQGNELEVYYYGECKEG
jgi:hypothetical protein